MTKSNFIVWLGGYLDGIDGPLDTARVKVIRDTMAQVKDEYIPSPGDIPTGPIFRTSGLYVPGDRGYGNGMNVTCDSRPVYETKPVLPKVDPTKVEKYG